MTIPHLKQRAEFYALCLEHGEENVEWRVFDANSMESGWQCADVDADAPRWKIGRQYQFRLRPRTVVIPEAVVPEEDPEGIYCMYIQTWIASPANFGTGPCKRYRTKEDLDAVVAAMMRREKR